VHVQSRAASLNGAEKAWRLPDIFAFFFFIPRKESKGTNEEREIEELE
jgi:hypothetical protein